MGILAMLTSVLFLYNHTGERQIVILQEKAKVINALLQAKTNSINTFISDQPVCGYGVHLESESYTLFRDLAAECRSEISDFRYTSANPEETISVHNLPVGYRFSSLPVQDILFIPPDPKVAFDGVITLGEEKLVVLASQDNNVSTNIRVNAVGQISAQ